MSELSVFDTLVNTDPAPATVQEIATVLELCGYNFIGNVAGLGNIVFKPLPYGVKKLLGPNGDYLVVDNEGNVVEDYITLDVAFATEDIYFAICTKNNAIIVDKYGINVRPLVKLDTDKDIDKDLDLVAFELHNNIYGFSGNGSDGFELSNISDGIFDAMRLGIYGEGPGVAAMLGGSVECLAADPEMLAKSKMLGIRLEDVRFGYSVPALGIKLLFAVDINSNFFVLDKEQYALEYKIYSKVMSYDDIVTKYACI